MKINKQSGEGKEDPLLCVEPLFCEMISDKACKICKALGAFRFVVAQLGTY